MEARPIAVAILNWNGAEDTLRCLESLRLQTAETRLRIVVVDNGSTDDSVERIRAWAAAHPDVDLMLVEAGENLGFAAGSNVAIREGLKSGAEYVLLLNNDTVVEQHAIARLVEFLVEHQDYSAVTGQIRYMDRPVIWNCGGDLTWFGSRRYLFGEQPVASTPQTGWRRITFITGCAALVRASAFAQHGLYTERFFFGEEDYEFSLRLQRAGCLIACRFDAVIRHNVGSSIDRVAPAGALGRYYIYYLNRFIDMRDYYPRPVWWLWRLSSLAFVLPRLRLARRVSWGGMFRLGARLLQDSARLDGVSKERFERANQSGLGSI